MLQVQLPEFTSGGCGVGAKGVGFVQMLHGRRLAMSAAGQRLNHMNFSAGKFSPDFTSITCGAPRVSETLVLDTVLTSGGSKLSLGANYDGSWPRKVEK